MIESIVVVGDGAAGAAAAFRARQAGVAVTVVSAGAGASALASGAADDVPWGDLVRAAEIAGTELRARALDPGVLAFAEALDLWRLPREGEPLPLLATTAGRVRPARGHDRALLDLAALPENGPVAVPRADRAGWDADALAAAWSDDRSARRRGLHFVPLDADLLLHAEEHRLPDADLAALHDDPARLAWLAARLREAFARAGIAPHAVIFGPWLGLDAPRAEALGARLGVTAGEALTGAGSPAGLRFARARDRLLAHIGVTRIRRKVTLVTTHAEGGEHATVTAEGLDRSLPADRVVLAAGGLAAGGVVYDPLDVHAGADVPETNAPPFRLSFDVDAPLGARPDLAACGARIGVASSMFGPELDLTAWPAPGRQGVLEAVGVACDPAGVCAPFLAAAGDAVADRPRTLLRAVQSGLAAGAWAASNPPTPRGR